MNQGLYHPSLNPNGSAKSLGDTFWYNTAQSFTTTADCFNPAKLLAGSGSIASGKSGRPDNRYFDAVYDSGFGGVCRDMRYSAYGLTPTDFAAAYQRVKNGTYRGFELGRFTQISSFVVDSLTPSTHGRVSVSQQDFSKLMLWLGHTGTSVDFITSRKAITLYNPSTGKMMQVWTLSNKGESNTSFTGNLDPLKAGAVLMGHSQQVVEATLNSIRLYPSAGNTSSASTVEFASVGDTVYVILTEAKMTSIGGSFLQTDVIGNPSNILATPQLANGWQGSWIPVIPDGTSKEFQFTRKLISTGQLVYTANNGAAWSMVSGHGVGFDTVKNSKTYTGQSGEVGLHQYQAFAKQTKPSANAVVYGGQSGVGDVLASEYDMPSTGSLLCESATGIILKGRVNIGFGSYAVAPVNFDAGSLHQYGPYYTPTHSPIALAAPVNNSAAFKALNYNVATNQQGFINYAYTELKHNGTNWGDDSKVTIVNNQSTKTDLNGNTVLVGTAQTCESLGWIKNKL